VDTSLLGLCLALSLYLIYGPAGRENQLFHKLGGAFGWVKTVAGGRKLRYCGVERNQLWAEVTLAGYNLVRMAKLTQATV
jgi:hypothetical protein